MTVSDSPRTRAALAAAALLAVAPAQAALTNCPDVDGDAVAYKIVVDDIGYALATQEQNPELAQLNQRLRFNFMGQMDRLRESTRQLDSSQQVTLAVVNCKDRKPSLNGAEFTPDLVRNLNTRKVVVETWVLLDLLEVPNQAPRPDARSCSSAASARATTRASEAASTSRRF